MTAPFTPPVAITIRRHRLVRANRPATRWWLNGDPVATAWFNALSGTFPRGEAKFIEALRAHRDGVDEELAARIRAFIAQETNHSRVHIAFNRMMADHGYDMARIDSRVAEMFKLLDGRPKILDLASTIALEHFTAIMAHQLLADPQYLAGGDHDIVALWRWHAVEEIEHKGVAYDTWLHATRDWSRWRRWRVKALTMLLVTHRFLTNRIRDTLDLLAQDGLTGWRVKWRLAGFLLWRPGMIRRIAPTWFSWFLPGFHPWNHDDWYLVVDTGDQAVNGTDNQAASGTGAISSSSSA